MEKIRLWKDRDKGIIDPELFSKRAEELSKKLAKESESQKGKINKRSQIRKFYDEVLKLETQANQRKDEWENILPLIHMLNAKAAYALGRNLISPTFLNFIKNSVDEIKEYKDLKVFANFFEAFMGFYRLHCKAN